MSECKHRGIMLNGSLCRDCGEVLRLTDLQLRAEKAEAQVEELEAWKRDMISVTPPMREIASEIDVDLGKTIHDKILPWVIQQKALVEELEGLTRPFRNGDVSVDTIRDIVNYYKVKGETK